MTVDLIDSIFHDEETARRHFEAIRWPDGPICPHCGVFGRRDRAEGQEHRGPGVYKCYALPQAVYRQSRNNL